MREVDQDREPATATAAGNKGPWRATSKGPNVPFDLFFRQVRRGSVKNLGLRCEWNRLLSQTVIQDRRPDLKHAMGPLRRPAHLPSLVHSGVDQLIDRALGP
jgi:hypothetical protein